MIKSIILTLFLALATLSPAMANDYPSVLKPIAISYVNGNGAGFSYNLISLRLLDLAKSPISLNLAPGVETNPNNHWQVSENVGAYIGVGPLEAGVSKTFSRGFGLGKPLEFSLGFNLFQN
jgi:hypothetical protein